MRIIFIFLFSFFPFNLYATEIKGKIVRVLDGDTVEIMQLPANLLVLEVPLRIRLQNIDAPEKAQPFGRWSTQQLKELVAGQSVTVTYTQTDRYGRVLGRVVTKNGIDANRYMVQKGAAWVYDQYNTDSTLPALQQEAQHEKRGLWVDKHPSPPWEWRKKNN